MDVGSSVNIILLNALVGMNIPESEITKRSLILIGFNGEMKHIIRDIKLPIYIIGVNSMQRSCVMNVLSSYNVILGRP